MTSELKRKVKKRKQKEDLDGSRLFREHGDDDLNNESMISQGQPTHQGQKQASQPKGQPQKLVGKSGQMHEQILKGPAGGPGGNKQR